MIEGEWDVAGPQVVTEGLDARLVKMLGEIGVLHRILFGVSLVVTSGRDGTHAPGSLHGRGLAVDLRSHDLTEVQQGTFAAVLVSYCVARGLSVFDERALPGAAHWHVEVAGGR